jgi:hypothetical protein
MSLFNLLPQTVLNLISEFNPEHRELMWNVFVELDDKLNFCDGCYMRIGEDGVDEDAKIKCRIMFGNYVFCCVWCRCDGEDFIRETYFRSVMK